MTAFTLTTGADNFAGDGAADTFTGPGGGLDTLFGGNGGDSFTIDGAQTGTINGGDGADSVTATQNQLDTGLYLTNVETLDVQITNLYARIAQLNSFATINPLGGGASFHVFLTGGGGPIDFSTRYAGIQALHVEATGLTAGTFLTGTAQADNFLGSSFNDRLTGLDGADSMNGAGGNDTIVGGLGADTLRGGAGADHFRIDSRFETGSAAGTRDVIADFQQGTDKIDLSAFDAWSGNFIFDSFVWIGTNEHTQEYVGSLRYFFSAGNTILTGKVGPNGLTSQIQINGIFELTTADFTNASIDLIGGNSNDDYFVAGPGGKEMRGFLGSDTLIGGSGNDDVNGEWHGDVLDGGAGNDTVNGGGYSPSWPGSDQLTGGSGSDVFEFDYWITSVLWGSVFEPDTITDFEQGLDTISVGGPGALGFIGLMDDMPGLGQLGYRHEAGNTIVIGQVLADRFFYLVLQGIHDLTPADFSEEFIASVLGTSGNDTLFGSVNAEAILGLAGNDSLTGIDADEILRGGLGADTTTGGLGADVFDFDAAAETGMTTATRDVITDFEQGIDSIDLGGLDADVVSTGVQHFIFLGTAGHTGGGATLRYQHASGKTIVYGDVDADGSGDFSIELAGIHNLTAADFTDLSIRTVQGTNNADVLTGSAGMEYIIGLLGNDSIVAGNGDDTVNGGAGADTVTGGAGKDRFEFSALSQLGLNAGARDIVTDFQQGQDVIDLSGIDAHAFAAGNQAFSFSGTAPHSGTGATLRYVQSGGSTLVHGDVNADGADDFTIELTGLYTLTAADFIL